MSIKTLTIKLADIEGNVTGLLAARADVEVRVAYSREVILTDGTVIPRSQIARNVSSSGSVSVQVYPSDDPLVKSEYRGFAIDVTVKGLPGASTIRYDRRVQVLDAMSSPVSLGELDPAEPVPSQWTSVTEMSDALAATRADAQAAVAGSRTASAAAQDAASLVGAPAGDVIRAVAITKASASLTPIYVPTLDLAGSIHAAPGVRSGLPATTHSVLAGDGTTTAQGYTTEHLATGVAGTKGAHSLTVADTTTLTTLHGDGSKVWDAAIVNGDGRAFTATVLSISGGTVTTLQPLPFDVAGGTLSSRVDAVAGQHLTKAGYKALAQHIAGWSPLVGTRGGILDGQWDTLPAALRDPWTRNAALTAYGVSNSPAPIVQSTILRQSPRNVYSTTGLTHRPNPQPGGVVVGTHAAGHGAISTLALRRRAAVVELATSAERGGNESVPAARVRVTATTSEGVVVYDRTTHGGHTWHRFPVTGADALTLEVTNTDGGIYSVNVGQTTAREAGVGDRLVTRDALLLGDSWTQYGDHYLGGALADALGATVATFGKGGTTTDWGIAWLDTALAAHPRTDTVILHFYTNDLNNNQGSTMTLPDGSTAPMWPNGLTFAQSEARWASQIRLLVAMIQQRGLRPVVILPGGVNTTNQAPASIHAEQPRLVEWAATATEIADSTAYVNTVGKRQGVSVTIGASVKTATGPAPEDPWINSAEDALVPIQRATLRRSTYTVSTVDLTVDTNSDGLADGITTQDSGTLTGDVYTASLVAGRQRLASSWAATVANGQRRLKIDAPVVAGREYLVVWDIVNATPSQTLNNSFSDVSGTAALLNTTTAILTMDAAGSGRVAYRATAGTTATRYASISRLRTNGATHTMDVRAAAIVDLTKLLADAPNLASKTTSELADFYLSLT